MSEKNIPAFPGIRVIEKGYGPNEMRYFTGMTIRQFYKGMAIQGCAMNVSGTAGIEMAARDAGRLADAMLKEDGELAALDKAAKEE